MPLRRIAAPRSRLAQEGARLVGLTLFQLPALLPLLRGTALPCTHDNLWHTFRIVAMREMLRYGWLFSRWLPNLALGYGYPFFNYREPLPYLAGEGLFALGVPLPLVLGLIYALALVASAYGAFVLGRELYGERAGWVAGVAYGLGPYVLLDPLRRGNMPESVALALIPWLFVATRRVIVGRRRGAILATVLLLGGLFLSHNISSLLLAPFLGAYVILLAVRHRKGRRWPYAFAAVGIAVLVTAWFWLPALTEQGWAQLHLSRTTRNNDFHYNFVSGAEMLATLPAAYDPAYLNPPMRITLGVGQAVLALAGAVVALGWPRDREQRALSVLFLVCGGVYLWMASPSSTALWERLSLLSFVQFPWRLVGRALLPASLLAGAGVEFAARRLRSGGASRWGKVLGTGVVCVAVAGLAVLAWPDAHPPKGMCPAPARPGLTDLYALEEDGWLGIDPESSYFPIWVENPPTDTTLAAQFLAGHLPQRFDGTALPEGGQVLNATYRPLRADLTVRAPAAFEARWLGLYFPGWEVRIDGQPVVAGPEDDTGLLTFPVPAGQHQIAVRFGSTPMRRAGSALGIAGIVGALGLWWILRRRGDQDGAPAPKGHSVPALVMIGVAAGLLVVRWTLPAPQAGERVAGDALPEVTTQRTQAFEGGMTLLGYTLPDGPLPADGELAVDLLWQAAATPATAYRTSVLLRGADGQFWSPAGTARPRGYERAPDTTAWQPGQYAYDPQIVSPYAGTPPGRYDVVVGVFDAATLAPASALDAEGQPEGPDLVLGTIEVVAPSQVPDLAALGVPAPATPVACGDIALLAMTADRETAVPGDIIAVYWVWEALAGQGTQGSEPVVATLTLIDAGGAVAGSWALPPATAWWPVARWKAGERWIGRHVVRLPGDLDSGAYTFAVQLPGCAAPLGVATVTVVAPARSMTVPEGFTPTDVPFGETIVLAGTSVAPPGPAPGDTIEVGLAWRATAAMATSYRVFLHLVGPDGRVVVQSDGVPAGWSRPTTGWAVGEVVSEVRTVSLPADAAAGSYVLRVGLYDDADVRLLTPDGADGAVIARFEVAP